MGVTTVIKDYGTDILNAIRENDLQRFKSIVEKHLKAEKKIQKLCISDIKHKPTKKFACPLILAARQDDPRILKYMMDRGVDPNFVHHTIYSSKRKEIVTALHIAVDLGLYDSVQIMLDANADCNIGDHNQETPLHIAVKKADRILVRILLSKGADPTLLDRRGNAALHIATLYGHLQLVQTLLKYDADVYQKGQSGAIPPHIAAKEGHIHLIQLYCLRDVGNINIKIPCYADRREKAPIHLAAENGHVETVRALINQFDADVNLKDSDRNTPLHCVVLNQYNPHRMREKDDFTEAARMLLKGRVSINDKNIYGDTALHLAAMNQYQRIVEMLLALGANPFLENDEHLKPIDVVPDFDPVTKQLLKNAMLGPRPPITASMDSLRKGYDLSPTPSDAQSLRKGHGIGYSDTNLDDEKMQRTMSYVSQSTMSIDSVFEDRGPRVVGPPPPPKNPPPISRDQEMNQSRSSKSSKSKSQESDDSIYNEIHQQDTLPVYTRPNKTKKTSGQQTAGPQMSSFSQQTTNQQHTRGLQTEYKKVMSMGTQPEVYEDQLSMVSDISYSHDKGAMTNELQRILSRNRRQMATYEDDASDTYSIQDTESEYMPMQNEQKKEKHRPVPRPRSRSSSKPSSARQTPVMMDRQLSPHMEEKIYANIEYDDYGKPLIRGAASEKPLRPPPRSQQGSTLDLHQQQQQQQFKEMQQKMQEQMQQLEQLQLQQQEMNKKSVSASDQKAQTISLDQLPAGIQIQNRQPKNRPGAIEVEYGTGPITISLDTHGSQYSVQQNSDGQTYLVSEDGQFQYSVNDLLEQHNQVQTVGNDYRPEYQGDLSTDFDDTEVESSSIISNDAQQEAVRQAIQQKVVELTETRYGDAQNPDISQILQEQEEPRLPMTPTKQARKPRKDTPARPSLQKKDEKKEQQQVNHGGQGEEEEVSPDQSPNMSPKFKNFKQALAFAKSQQLAHQQKSQNEVRLKEEEEARQQQLQDYLRHQQEQYEQAEEKQQKKVKRQGNQLQKILESQNMVSTPENKRWHSQQSTDTAVVESNREESPTPRQIQMRPRKQWQQQQQREHRPTSQYMSSDFPSSSVEDLIEKEPSYPSDSDEDEETEDIHPSQQSEDQHQLPQKSHDLYYSITPGIGSKESGPGSSQPEPRPFVIQPAPSNKVSETPSTVTSIDTRLGSKDHLVKAQVSEVQVLQSSEIIIKGHNQLLEREHSPTEDIIQEYEEEPGSHHLRSRSVEIIGTSPNHSMRSPTRSQGARTPDSLWSVGSSGSGLNMRVTGEMPKAYTRRTKAAARTAFIKAPPQGIESSSECSDVEYLATSPSFDKTSHAQFMESPKPVFSTTSMSPNSLISTSPPSSTGSPPKDEKDPKTKKELLGASIPKPYKTFGKIDPKIDALLEAMDEAASHRGLSDFDDEDINESKEHEDLEVFTGIPTIQGSPRAIRPKPSEAKQVMQAKITKANEEIKAQLVEESVQVTERTGHEKELETLPQISTMQGSPRAIRPKARPRKKSKEKKTEVSTAPLHQHYVDEEEIKLVEETTVSEELAGESVAKSTFKKNIKVREEGPETYESEAMEQNVKPQAKRKTVTVKEQRWQGENVIETLTTAVMPEQIAEAEKVSVAQILNESEDSTSSSETSESSDEGVMEYPHEPRRIMPNAVTKKETSGTNSPRTAKKILSMVCESDENEPPFVNQSETVKKRPQTISPNGEQGEKTAKKKLPVSEAPIQGNIENQRKILETSIDDEMDEDEVYRQQMKQLSSNLSQKQGWQRGSQELHPNSSQQKSMVVPVQPMETDIDSHVQEIVSDRKQEIESINKPLETDVGVENTDIPHQTPKQLSAEPFETDIDADIAKATDLQAEPPRGRPSGVPSHVLSEGLPQHNLSTDLADQEVAFLSAVGEEKKQIKKSEKKGGATGNDPDSYVEQEQQKSQLQQPVKTQQQDPTQKPARIQGRAAARRQQQGQVAHISVVPAKSDEDESQMETGSKVETAPTTQVLPAAFAAPEKGKKNRGFWSLSSMKKKKDKGVKGSQENLSVKSSDEDAIRSTTSEEKTKKKSLFGKRKGEKASTPEQPTVTIMEMPVTPEIQHLAISPERETSSGGSEPGTPTSADGFEGTVMGAPTGSNLDRSDTIRESGKERRKAGFFSLGSMRTKKKDKERGKGEEEYGAVPYNDSTEDLSYSGEQSRQQTTQALPVAVVQQQEYEVQKQEVFDVKQYGEKTQIQQQVEHPSTPKLEADMRTSSETNLDEVFALERQATKAKSKKPPRPHYGSMETNLDDIPVQQSRSQSASDFQNAAFAMVMGTQPAAQVNQQRQPKVSSSDLVGQMWAQQHNDSLPVTQTAGQIPPDGQYDQHQLPPDVQYGQGGGHPKGRRYFKKHERPLQAIRHTHKSFEDAAFDSLIGNRPGANGRDRHPHSYEVGQQQIPQDHQQQQQQQQQQQEYKQQQHQQYQQPQQQQQYQQQQQQQYQQQQQQQHTQQQQQELPLQQLQSHQHEPQNRNQQNWQPLNGQQIQSKPQIADAQQVAQKWKVKEDHKDEMQQILQSVSDIGMVSAGEDALKYEGHPSDDGSSLQSASGTITPIQWGSSSASATATARENEGLQELAVAAGLQDVVQSIDLVQRGTRDELETQSAVLPNDTSMHALGTDSEYGNSTQMEARSTDDGLHKVSETIPREVKDTPVMKVNLEDADRSKAPSPKPSVPQKPANLKWGAGAKPKIATKPAFAKKVVAPNQTHEVNDDTEATEAEIPKVTGEVTEAGPPMSQKHLQSKKSATRDMQLSEGPIEADLGPVQSSVPFPIQHRHQYGGSPEVVDMDSYDIRAPPGHPETTYQPSTRKPARPEVPQQPLEQPPEKTRKKKSKKPKEEVRFTDTVSDTEVGKHSRKRVSLEAHTYSDAEAFGMEEPPRDPGKSLQEAAMESITANLSNRPRQKPHKPWWQESDRAINYTTGVYRPPTIQFRPSDGGSGRYDDSHLVSRLWSERSGNFGTESEGEADTEDYTHETSFDVAPIQQPRMQQNNRYSTMSEGNDSVFAAPPPASPAHSSVSSTKRVTIVEGKGKGKKKKKKKKDKPPSIMEPGPVDFSQYPVTARIWMEQVDRKTVQKSKTMSLMVMPEGMQLPQEVQKSFPAYVSTSDDVLLPPQWVIARGRTLRKRSKRSSSSLSVSRNPSTGAESDVDVSPDRPMSPGRQVMLFFRVGSNWRDLAWILFDGIYSEQETLRLIKDIQLKHPGELSQQVQDLMHRWWKKKKTDATIEELQRALDVVNLGYIQEDYLDQKNSLTLFTDTEDDLDISEVSDTDPDVSRLIGEYEIRSMNSSFDCENAPDPPYPVRPEQMMARLGQTGMLRAGQSRDSLGQRSAHSQRTQDSSRDSLLDDGDRKFLIVTPQLKHADYRHETTI